MATVVESTDAMQIGGDVPFENEFGNNSSTSRLFSKVASSGAFFKSQQIDDPELTYQEKHDIAREIWRRGPDQFLARFHAFLGPEDASLFRPFRHNYEVAFYLGEIEKRNCKRAKIEVKNRRYEALKRLIESGEYFSNNEMKKRNPLMFHQMVGQYMTDDELEEMERIDMADLRFTTILMDHIDRDHTETLRKQQEALEQEEEEEEDSSDEGAEAMEEVGRKVVSSEEKHLLREEFLSFMYQSFLDGKDAEFNYSSVDHNDEYDCLYERQQDAEDDYFDHEDPAIVPTPQNPEPDDNVDYDSDISCFLRK